MTEKGQATAAANLRAYAEQIKVLIDGGTHFLFTGNSLELRGKYIETANGDKIKALGILEFYSFQPQLPLRKR
jgi:CobQ-like glutamine amidotransferase family enzyme